MHKLALGIEYDGSPFCGWQKQKYGISVQDCVEYALKKITLKPVTVFCAGRTDAGVHALEQVVHFKTDLKYPKSAWTLGVNRYLPTSICIRWVNLVQDDFHARFSAVSRRYYYYIYNDYIRSSILFHKTWHYKKLLDICKMSKAAQYLLGENDFSAFQSLGCQSSSSRRMLYHLDVIRMGKVIIIDIKANSFLYHMVRNIVGSLVEVGCGNRSEIWILDLLKSCKRSLTGMTAPAKGLFLAKVQYPGHFFVSTGEDSFYK